MPCTRSGIGLLSLFIFPNSGADLSNRPEVCIYSLTARASAAISFLLCWPRGSIANCSWDTSSMERKIRKEYSNRWLQSSREREPFEERGTEKGSVNSCPLCGKVQVSARMAGTGRNLKTGWRRGWDSNPRDPFGPNGFQDRRSQPLSYPSCIISLPTTGLGSNYQHVGLTRH
jgi:hypothetical protein